MFDLENEVRSWRQGAADACSRDILEELEEHLREEFDSQLRQGHSPEEAFARAKAQIGDIAAVARECARAERHGWRPTRITASSLLGAVAIVIAALTFTRMQTGQIRLLGWCHVVFLTLGHVAVFALGVMGAGIVVARVAVGPNNRLAPAFQRAGYPLTAFALVATLIGVTLGAVWSAATLGSAWHWDPKEIGGVCVLAWACVLFLGFSLTKVSIEAKALITLLGSMVVALAWIGPNLLRLGLHQYGRSPATQSMLLAGVTLTQMILIGVLVSVDRGTRSGLRRALRKYAAAFSLFACIVVCVCWVRGLSGYDQLFWSYDRWLPDGGAATNYVELKSDEGLWLSIGAGHVGPPPPDLTMGYYINADESKGRPRLVFMHDAYDPLAALFNLSDTTHSWSPAHWDRTIRQPPTHYDHFQAFGIGISYWLAATLLGILPAMAMVRIIYRRLCRKTSDAGSCRLTSPSLSADGLAIAG